MLVLNKRDNPNKPHMVYIGRGSNYDNPIQMATHRNDRNVVVAIYEQHFISNLLTSRDFCVEVEKLNAFNNLLCHCAPEKCHGDVIKEFVVLQEEYGQKEAIKMFVERKKYKHLTSLDGVTHVNIYSKSRCPLGLMLSHFYRAPFEHPKFGKFESVEGFWFYVSTGMRHEFLRNMWGYDAKEAGSKLEKVNQDNFLLLVEEANECKIRQNPVILKALLENTKPFLHYYSYGQPHNAVIRKIDNILPVMFNNIVKRIKPSFRTIIAGSRDFFDLWLFKETMANIPWNISTVIDGDAKGGDLLGNIHARNHGIDCETFKADWDTHGKAAGMLRNKEMEKEADKAVVFVKNKSKGSMNMVSLMKNANKEVLVVEC